MTLPKALAAILQIPSKESSLAVLVQQGHIEIWTLGAIRASLETPLIDLL